MLAQADREQLPASRRAAVATCHCHLTGHLDQLHYDIALASGRPIATGAIEGACRHLIGGRLNITGARWGRRCGPPGQDSARRLLAGFRGNNVLAGRRRSPV